MMNDNLTQWHKIVTYRNWIALNEMLDDNVEFHSPFVWKPKKNKSVTAFILKNVSSILSDFSYSQEWIKERDMALEFSARIGELNVKGIDLLK